MIVYSNELRLRVARAIWARRPDCVGKPWPIKTKADWRAYPHNPIAAVDLCLIYADAAIHECIQANLSAAEGDTLDGKKNP